MQIHIEKSLHSKLENFFPFLFIFFLWKGPLNFFTPSSSFTNSRSKTAFFISLIDNSQGNSIREIFRVRDYDAVGEV